MAAANTERAMQAYALVPTFLTVARGAQWETQRSANHRFAPHNQKSQAERPTIILVRDRLASSSGWQEVSRLLRKEGHVVRIVKNPTTSLADDVAVTRHAVDGESGPVILVGHGYGGAVITEVGNHPKVVGLVYVSAFVPDQGESVSWLIRDPSPCAPIPDIALPALNGTVSDPAWRKKPSWYLVAADDRLIPSRAQWAMAKRAGSKVTETGGGDTLFVATPAVVAEIIGKAVRGVAAPGDPHTTPRRGRDRAD